MVGRIWRICLIAYLLVCGFGLQLVGGSAPAQPSALGHRDEGLGVDLRSISPAATEKYSLHERVEENFGSDMCPECKPLPTTIPRSPSSSELDVDEGLGADMCPECRLPAAAAASEPRAEVGRQSLCRDKSVDCHAVSNLGADMCPECRQPVLTLAKDNTLPQQQPSERHQQLEEMKVRTRGERGENAVENYLGADMCPECRQPLLEDTTIFSPNLVQSSKEAGRSYGTDMCPECRVSLPGTEEVPNLPHSVKMDVIHKEMHQQLLSEARLDSDVPSPTRDFSNAVLELQKLAIMQQAQLDQLSGLLQQLGRPLQPRSEAKAARKNEAKEQQEAVLGATEQPSDSGSAVAKTLGEPRPVLDGKASSVAFAETSSKLEPQILHKDTESAAALPKSSESFITQQQQQQATGGSSSSSSGGGGMTVARYRPAWSEHFSFLSAVKVDGEVSCLHLLPQEGEEGTSRYFVIGDTTGRLYIFLWLGDLLLDHRTVSPSPITSMLSYTLQKNETILVTGHSDGTVVVHQVLEKEEHGSISDDGRVTLVSIKTLHTLVPPATPSSSPASGVTTSSEAGKNGNSGEEGKATDNKRPAVGGKGGGDEETSDHYRKNNAVTNLEMYKVGKMRYTLVGDASGKIRLFKDNGSLHGVVQSPSRPLAFMRIPSAQRFIFLTDVGVGLLDFRSMQLRRYPCEGLNGSRMAAYSFDVIGRSKAHGFTSDGDLVSVALSGDMLHFECHVKRKRKLQITGPIVSQALKGYLIASTWDRIFVFNTTLPSGLNYASFRVAGPAPLFAATRDEVALSFLRKPGVVKHSRWPLLASNRDRLVVVGFSDGYVGVFRSNLPTTRPADFSVKFWNSSILVSGLAILVVWQLIAKKKDSAASAGTGGIDHTLTTGSGNLMAFDKEESSRLGFEQARKGPEPRGYGSPTRGYVDSKSATFGSDPMRYRSSSAVDTGLGYSAMREPLFASTQPVGELELRQ